MSNPEKTMSNEKTFPEKFPKMNLDFLIGIFLSLLTVFIISIPYTNSQALPSKEAKVLSSFAASLFGVSAIASFRRASENKER
jgi:uncharacterized membrane protein YfcA